MKQALLTALILAAGLLVVAAVVFRNKRALEILKTLRNAAWLYIGAIVLLAAAELARRTDLIP